jgi:putative CocE/NonD family hydrolase
LALYRSLAKAGVPQKLVIGPWYHCGWYRSHLNDAAADAVRWFDYWLKGIPDGIMDSAPIRYYVVGAPAGQEWKTATQWPLPNAKPRIYFLSSENALTFQRSKRTDSNDRYTVRYRLTSERLALRFTMGQTGEVEPGLTPIVTSELDANSVSYSSPPLEKDAQLTGFPVITLWATSTAKDQDFFVYLEDVDPTGRSTLLTDGALRASNRAIQTPSFDNEGLPWHGGNKFDRVDLQPEAPAELRWALFPLSNYVKKGHRLRISINSFDQDAWDSPKIEPAPTVTLLHDQSHPSSITLPFVQ